MVESIKNDQQKHIQVDETLAIPSFHQDVGMKTAWWGKWELLSYTNSHKIRKWYKWFMRMKHHAGKS